MLKILIGFYYFKKGKLYTSTVMAKDEPVVQKYDEVKVPSLCVRGGSPLQGGCVLLQRNAWLRGGRKELLPKDFRLPLSSHFVKNSRKGFWTD